MSNVNKNVLITIINSNKYLSLATTDGQSPWVAPLYYCLDQEFNLYFISQLDSVHSQHLVKNPKVAFAIFDSHQEEGTGNGIQGSGVVKLLTGDDLKEGLKHYHTNFVDLNYENLSKDGGYKLFKLEVQKWYILDTEVDTDKRVEVKLEI